MHAGALLVVALVVGGCGGSDEPSDDPESSGDATVTDPDSTPEDGDAEPEGTEAGGSSAATLTMSDDTVYEFVLTSCKTQDTDPSGFPISNGYDITGKSADGAFGTSISRAGFTDEDIFFAGLLEGDFDDEGKNAAMLYSVDSETVDLTATGNQVSGSLDFRAIGPTRPHGDSASGTLEATC